MAAIGAILAKVTLAKALSAGGTILSGLGAVQQGRSAQAAANFQAAQLERHGKAESAAAQRAAVEERRKKDFVLSRARAVAAASGGGQDIGLMGEIEEEGEYRVRSALWEGEESRKGRNTQAASSRIGGELRKTAGLYRAGTTLLSGGTSFFEKYG